MTFKTGARIQETSSTTGTGTWTLLGAPTGFQSFSVLGNNNLTPYFATDGTNWEEGIGTVLTGPNRLARTHVLDSSNAGAAVNFLTTVTIRCGPIGKLAAPRRLSKSVAGGPATITLTQDEQRNDILEFTGALTGNTIVEVDATVWNWAVHNNTSGAFTLTMRVAGQTGVAIPQGRRAALYCNSSDVIGQVGIPGAAAASEFDIGTRATFQQTAAPSGWAKDTSTHNDKAIRVTTGTVGSGGSTSFTSTFGAGKSTAGFAITTNEMANHTHTTIFKTPGSAGVSYNGNASTTDLNPVNAAGNGASHAHTLSLDLQYCDIIIAARQ